MFERINNLQIEYGKITSINDIPEKLNKEFKHNVLNCLEDCKSLIKNGDEEKVLLLIDKEIKVEWLQKYLRTTLDRIMFGYKSLEPLRNMESNNNILPLINFVNDIFENSILRNNIVFSKKYEEYGLETEEQIRKICFTFKTLVSFYVIHRYTQDSIIIDFKDETGLSESVAKFVAENIEKNYSQLQIIVLLANLANTENQL